MTQGHEFFFRAFRSTVFRVLWGLAVFFTFSPLERAQAATWNNNNCDFCQTIFPSVIDVGTATEAENVDIFGQIFVSGLTDANSTPAAGISAELGLGPLNSDPRVDGGWTWGSSANPNPSFDFTGNNDEYIGNLPTPQAGDFAFAYRFSLDNGASWTLADFDGDLAQLNLGSLTVATGPAPVPAPSAMLLMGTGLLGLVGWSWWNRKHA